MLERVRGKGYDGDGRVEGIGVEANGDEWSPCERGEIPLIPLFYVTLRRVKKSGALVKSLWRDETEISLKPTLLTEQQIMSLRALH